MARMADRSMSEQKTAGQRRQADPEGRGISDVRPIILDEQVMAAIKQAAVQRMHEVSEAGTDGAVGLREARTRLGELVGRVQHGGERITITRSGKPAAMLIPVEDWEILLGLMNRIDNEIADRVLADPEASFEPYVPKSRRNKQR